MVDGAPTPEWVAAVNRLTESTSTLLIVDELKTGLRLDPCGSSRFGFRADLIVLGKALGNGLPLAAVAGSRDLMAAVERTWISSTLATEFVSLAAAGAVLDRYLDGDGARVRRNAERAWTRWADLAGAVPSVTLTGIPEMAYLRFPDEAQSTRFAAACATRGLLFKRNAYNFPSLVHDDAVLEETVACLDSVLREVASW